MRFAQRQIFCELQETLNERNYVLPLIYGDQLSSENCFDYILLLLQRCKLNL